MRMGEKGEAASYNAGKGSKTGYTGADNGHGGFEDGPDSSVDKVPSNVLLIKLRDHDDPNYAHEDGKAGKSEEGY